MTRMRNLVLVVLIAISDIPINPDVTQHNISDTICVRGWTKTVRPPLAYSNAVKKELFSEYGLPLSLMGDFQLDHIIPLGLGGSPADLRNLQLQDADEAEQKDDVERCLMRAVCQGRVELDEARRLIWGDWKAARGRC
jgi:hypothetical protein